MAKMTAETTKKTTEMMTKKDDKTERLAWCDDLTYGLILALRSAYWQHRPMFELVFVAYGHFFTVGLLQTNKYKQ